MWCVCVYKSMIIMILLATSQKCSYKFSLKLKVGSIPRNLIFIL